MLRYWLGHDAAWWQFWFPGSGLIGGMIAGAIVFTICLIL